MVLFTMEIENERTIHKLMHTLLDIEIYNQMARSDFVLKYIRHCTQEY